MKKLYLILLMLLLLFIPTSVNAVAIYQLDQPIKELDNYTLRQVFSNRNMARPDLTGKTEISAGVYRLNTVNGLTVDYNIIDSSFIINGLTSASGIIWIILEKEEYIDNLTFTTYYQNGYITPDMAQWLVNNVVTTFQVFTITNQTVTKEINDNVYRFGFYYNNQSSFENYIVKVQLESGSIATPYQVPTNGPYNQFDFGWLDLTSEQIQTYYDLYLEAVRFEQENIQASQDNGGYQNIFKAIINGVKNLMVEMGYVWSWLNAPLITSDMTSYQFNIDWSWDLIGVVRQILNSAGILTMQILFIVPSLAFAFMGIPVHVSILSLLFSNLIFLLLGWIMVKSFLI